ncbi:MAG: bifunctional phosphopantothenoylcysteine decarboxylase/phosphopantothenate--cysteine ligase CoaBC [Candidatus Gastranaerophilales bacterium]|nr:bifunctional phosphopantothenoylcysteine decarboxylase/phosphopantothenate--cysteine ligase CoaBC [Candidatus Gastranaerophilales bacterium]
MELSQNKTILIGITGGIAAYKIYELIRMYKKNGFNVKVLATPNAMHFISELTLVTLSGNGIYKDNFEINEYKPEHISLCDEGDILVIAPATANTISKIANGICDNLLTSTCCAFIKPVIIAPAMNTNMWKNPVIQDNIKKLNNNGYKILPPESGYLACGTEGNGRLCGIETIYNATVETLNLSKKLKGKKIVITAGGTVEKIDPVRYISNFSSGKMGTALADAAHLMGGNVRLISTFDINRPYEVTQVQSALEMEKEIVKHIHNSDCIIMAAAVGDYRIENYSEQKLKKTNEDALTLKFVKNPDILKKISQTKNDKVKIAGFCAESENLIENARQKIINKGCDYLIANDISRKDIGFSSDDNEVYILDKSLNIKHLEKNTKQHIAREILEYIFE